jgi:hypothetical protein
VRSQNCCKQGERSQEANSAEHICSWMLTNMNPQLGEEMFRLS